MTAKLVYFNWLELLYKNVVLMILDVLVPILY